MSSSAATFLRAARRSRGVSQRDLAQASGQAQPGIAAIESGSHDTTLTRLDALLRPLGYRLSLLPTRARPVCEAAVAVRAALSRDDEATAWREVIQLADDLARQHGATLVALSVAPPPPTGDPRYDAVIAAVTDQRLSERRLPRPEWLDEPAYRLMQPWDVEEVAELRQQARHATPAAIRRHGVYLHPRELQSL